MNIIHMTWGEVPRESSVYGGQVVEVVRSLQSRSEVESAALLSGVPLIHSGLVRERWNYPNEIRKIQARIGPKNFVRRTIFTPPVGVHPTRRQLPMFLAGHMGYLARLIAERRAQVIQCRSYVSTLLALRTRRRYGLSIRIVFDSRSYMADEATLMGRWTVGSPDHQFWLERQSEMLRDADLTTVVSAPMKDHFDALGARRCEIVHLNVDHECIRAVPDQPQNGRDMTLVYAGYLSERGWHSPKSLWQIFHDVSRLRPGTKLLVISRSPHSELRSSLQETGFGHLENKISFTSAASPRDVVGLLRKCDAAILSYRDPTSRHEQFVASSVFATKTAEYLMAGLPVLVNGACGGAASYISSHNAGIVYDSTRRISQGEVDRLFALCSDRARISSEARDVFSLDRNAERLVRLYSDIIGTGK